MENITISLPVNAWNIVLNALANRPYAEVADLLEQIKKQAADQLQPGQTAGSVELDQPEE